MKVPVSWLKEYVDFDVAPDELGQVLTMAGVEVEGIETVGSDYPGVVVGEVTSVEPHPAAGKLRVCRVNDGSGELDVVCGADNVGPGVKVPFAGVGAVLPCGMAVEEKSIRGTVSKGMLCAEDELGISDDHSGVMILSDEAKTGTPFVDVFGPPETVFDLEVTWNRPDCLSIIGIAREVAAALGTGIKRPAVEYAEDGGPVEESAVVTVEDAVGCPRYTGRVLAGVQIGPSPLWMRRRLLMCGIRPISNIVDITNYVLLECGHPLHAFDHSLLHDHTIIVRRGAEGEKLSMLDGIERDVAGLLVIADSQRAVALAGVMGGEDSEIKDNTGTILLESACFHPPDIRRASSVLGLSTESSYRFERGVDVEGVDWASRRAAGLMVELAGAVAARGVVDVYARPHEERNVACRFEKARLLLGIYILPDEIVSILESLEFRVVARDDESCTVCVPSFRPDIEREADLVEEIARCHGLDQVPAAVPASQVDAGRHDERAATATAELRANLVSLGLNEIMNYSFLSPELLDAVPVDDPATRIVLPNPVNVDQSVLRNSLLPQMVTVIGRNVARQAPDLGLFELGRVFHGNGKGDHREELRLAIGLTGRAGRWGAVARKPATDEETFLWMKGIIEALCAAQRIPDLRVEPCRAAAFQDGWCVAVKAGGTPVGTAGLLGEEIRRSRRMAAPVAVAELLVEPLLERAFEVPAFAAVSPYPCVVRDMALVVADSVSHESIVKTIRECAPDELTGIELFDTFRGEGIGSGRKSLAYSLVYRSMTRTLTDEDANRYHEAIKDVLRNKLNAEIREG